MNEEPLLSDLSEIKDDLTPFDTHRAVSIVVNSPESGKPMIKDDLDVLQKALAIDMREEIWWTNEIPDSEDK